MFPISARGFGRTARAAAVAVAITALTSGATIPAMAAPQAIRPGAVSTSPPTLADERFVAPAVVRLSSATTTSGRTEYPWLSARAVQMADADSAGTATFAGTHAVKPVNRPTHKPARRASPNREHHGRNHMWSASLGLDRSVSWFSCSRSRPPDYVVYRWGCAGADNVYLFAHAGGPFHKLHDLYVRGRLQRGMSVTYADADGRVHRYAVAWWRTVLPTDGAFAYAAQARPSMTLQTCVGPHDRYRLVVRLYQTD